MDYFLNKWEENNPGVIDDDFSHRATRIKRGRSMRTDRLCDCELLPFAPWPAELSEVPDRNKYSGLV